MEAKVEDSQAKKSRIPVLVKVAAVWIGVYLVLKLVIKPPLPSSIIFMYMTTVTVGLALAVSIYEQILHDFLDPIIAFVHGDPTRGILWRGARWVFLIALPVYIGYGVHSRLMPRFEPPIASRVIHPAPPPEVAALSNPFRDDEANLEKNIEEGRVVYFQNCFFCHGDALKGAGPFAHGINPPPADFQDSGTIAQLTESFVYWRIATGGPGLPDESTPWDSFMPQWDTMLTQDQMWKVILYLYDATGWSPRTWGEAESKGAFETEEEETEETGEKGAEKDGGQEASKKMYEKRCSQCHGTEGKADGPAAKFSVPRPRDFTWGVYKLRTMPSGYPPTDEDLFRTIRRGIPGTTMPGWKEFTDDEVKGLIQYIKGFAPDVFESDDEMPAPITIGEPPKSTPELIEKGKKLFTDSKCWECHGKKGRGNGKKSKAPEFKDDWGYRIAPRNLTHPWEFRGGEDAAVEDIYRAITTGLDGTPMASFQDSLPDEDRWALAHYVKSLQVKRQLGYTILATHSEKLPDDPDDPIWDTVVYMDIPMVGQVTIEPRMFTPKVDNVRIQAIYNAEGVAFRVIWDDTTQNKPDPASEIFEDTVAVQFPVITPTGSKRPFYLMGDEDNPVNLWRWSQERSKAIELNANGSKNLKAQDDGGQEVAGKIKYDDGQYRVVFKRTLSTSDKDHDVQFEPGKFIPMSFFAWDGVNKETGVKCSISSWYFLLLVPNTPVTVYIYPFVVLLMMGGAEWLLIKRIRKNKGRVV